MKQINFRIRDTGDFTASLSLLKTLPEYQTANDVLSIVVLGVNKIDFAQKMISSWQEKGMKGHLVGFTAHTQICDGVKIQKQITLTVFIFNSSSADVYVLNSDDKPYIEHAAEFSKIVSAEKNAKAVQVFVNVFDKKEPESFYNNLNFDFDRVPVVGGSGGTEFDPTAGDGIFLFTGEKILSNSVIAIIYKGEELFVHTETELGWIPIGSEHEITKVTGTKLVSEVDGKPAVELFEKYLGIARDNFFSANVIDFPWHIVRDGTDLILSPVGKNKDNDIVFSATINEGEKFHFAFGSVRRILSNSEIFARRLVHVQPQAVFLTVCEARQSYLNENEQTEIDFFSYVCPSVAGGGAFGELSSVAGKVRGVNCAMVLLAMREGLPESVEPEGNFKAPTGQKNGPMPLLDRLYNFIKVTSDEYAVLREHERELELRRFAEAEKAANEAKSDFLSNMSHEIRTPISAVLGMNEMILRESRNPAITAYSENIAGAGNTLLSLINDILDFSKIEAGKMEIIPASYSFASLIYEIIVMMSGKAESKGLNFALQIDPEIPDSLNGDMLRIRQILLNILSNAIKYTKKGQIELTASFMKVGPTKVAITFHVLDTGSGIKEEDIPKIFKPFERVDQNHTKAIEGTGLGISITTRLLELMKSRLEVRSEWGRGSDFYFTIEQDVLDWKSSGDFEERARENSKHERERAKAEAFHAPDAIILAVDDTPMNLAVIKSLLKRTEIQIETASSGREAIDLASKQRFDLILMDQRMPELDGSETLKEIRSLGEKSPNIKTPVVVLTATAIAGTREKLIADGFDDYLSKPVNPADLELVILRYLPPEKIKSVQAPDDLGPSMPESDFPENVTFTPINSEDVLFDDGRIPDGEPEEEEEPLFIALKKIPGLDLAAGLAYCGGKDAFKELIEVFTNSSTEGADVIEEYFKAADWENYTVKVHALKSSARIIGAAALSADAAYLEQCGNEENIDEIKAKTEKLLFDYRCLVLKIREAMDSLKKNISPAELESAFLAVGEFIKAGDFSAASSVISELNTYALPESKREKVAKIILAIETRNAGEIFKILEEK